ncbi:MAG TPA: lysophospholipid acyltransferase family protein, partial [Dehalococcoidia bacterium]|nr:lysophospholipid acyltransferase family protein [Dehalococcoidia bacterium]
NPELAIQALLARGYPVFALTEPLEPPALSRFLDERRSAAGHRFRAATYAALKEAMRTLRAGSNIALMFDRDIRGRSITIDLCGAPAQVPVGAVEFALRTGAPIVPVFIHRRVDQRFDVWIEPALHVGNAGDREARVRETVRELFRRFEAHLRCDPGQWMVLERIWDAPG